jgi:hypothetical protein
MNSLPKNIQFLFLSTKIHQFKPKKTAWAIWLDLIAITTWIATEKINHQNYRLNRSFSWQDIANRFGLSKFVAKARFRQLVEFGFLIQSQSGIFLPTCPGEGLEVRLSPQRLETSGGVPIKRDFLIDLFNQSISLREKALFLVQILNPDFKMSTLETANFRTVQKNISGLAAAGLVSAPRWKTPKISLPSTAWLAKVKQKGHYQAIIEGFILDNGGIINELDNFYPLIRIYKKNKAGFRSFERFLGSLSGTLEKVVSPAAVLMHRAQSLSAKEPPKPAYFRKLEPQKPRDATTTIENLIEKAKKILHLAIEKEIEQPKIDPLLRPGGLFWAAAVCDWGDSLGLSPPT